MNNNLIWASDAGNKAKNEYESELNKQVKYCESIKLFLEVYEKGINGFGDSIEELKKKFRELQEENNKIIKGDIDDVRY